MTSVTIIPAEHPLIIPKRATLREIYTLPFAWNNHEAIAQVYDDYEKNTLIATLDIETIEYTPNWKIAVSAPWDAFINMTRDGVWDLLVINDDLTRDHYLKGPAVIDERVSQVPAP